MKLEWKMFGGYKKMFRQVVFRKNILLVINLIKVTNG